MKKILIIPLTIIFSGLVSSVHADVLDIGDEQVGIVYQSDLSATEFEFLLPSSSNNKYTCTGNAGEITGNGTGKVFRVKSPNVEVANRKFSMMLTALTTKTKIRFRTTGICESGRMIVSWIQLIN